MPRPRPIVTLTTDFGTRDPYAACLKAVILGIAPDAALVDLTHEVAPGDVRHAALTVLDAAPFFPAGTVHLVVVDPGVGTQRRILAARMGKGTVIGPDNGLFGILRSERALGEVREVRERRLFRAEVSSTFHGRDIMAPVAAHLASGGRFASVGPAVRDVVETAWPKPSRRGKGLAGEVVHVDRFGNLLTNIRRQDAGREDFSRSEVRIGGKRTRPAHTYGDGRRGELLALWSSFGRLEIAVKGGSAARAARARVGTPVTVG